ncbi:venom dipeptidyl peptidase 4-like isoform X2 [Hyposmocoma kahamanoa]|uniref:venom dipeptidyl peptidase 4-like isoform X2 n=1 Tax=Hyposmocoma kahamanoa TaxID=1477025 RepID=UPI000E6D84B7|nr:venom dipeptidyl peptidase 4-like isoform X2 [Hyposmocoma kahamanoa]
MSYIKTMIHNAILVLVLLGYHTESSPQNLKTFTLEELIPLKPDFYPERISVDWTSDTEYITFDPAGGIKKFDASINKFITLLDTDELIGNNSITFNLSGHAFVSFSKDSKYLLMSSQSKKVYRHSSLAKYSLYNLEKKILTELGKGYLQTAIWGGDHSIAYVQDNNVYYVADSARPDDVTILTNEGVVGQVYFGVTDWIYEEEIFNAAEAVWFSPNGTYLAVASFNDTLVESVVYPIYGNPADVNFQYSQEVRFKYPKAGRVNPVVGLRVFKVNNPETDAWNIPAPVDVVGLDHILGRVNWASDHNLLVLWLNRRQNLSVLVNCELQIDKCNIVRQRVEPNGWIDLNTPYFDSTGTKMIEIEPQELEERKFLHATRFDLASYTLENLTPTNATVTDILGWNDATKTLYYIVSPSGTPWQRQLWSTSGSVVRCISCRESSCHHTSGMFSTGSSYGVLSCSSTNTAPKTFLYNSQVDTLTLIKDSTKLSEKLSQYKMPMTLFNIIPLGDNVYAHVKLLLPPEMVQGQKYPLVVRVYAGPGTVRVKDNFDLEYYNLYLAGNRSFIVGSVDVRGSGAMGVEAMFAVKDALGTVEVTDSIAAIRRLLETYPFIDPSKVGVWGWSYGGYATTMMLIQDDLKTITCGAAVAPVTSWLYYDTIYTERYMDLPQANPVGYQRSDLLALAPKLRGRKYLLVHGTGDDNVHYQHSLQLAKVLQHADIPFEQMSYTDETHSLLGVSRHFYHTLDHFWTECFSS